MVVQIGIAMYRITNDANNDPYFQWRLCLATSLRDEEVRLFEIIPETFPNSPPATSNSAPPRPTSWKRQVEHVNLTKSDTFRGIVYIGQTDELLEEMDGFVRENCPPSNHHDFEIVGPLRGWTCEAWIMRALLLLQDAEILELPCPPDVFYSRVMKRAEHIMSLYAHPALYQGAFPIVAL